MAQIEVELHKLKFRGELKTRSGRVLDCATDDVLAFLREAQIDVRVNGKVVGTLAYDGHARFVATNQTVRNRRVQAAKDRRRKIAKVKAAARARRA